MIYIAHRGLYSGPNAKKENSPEQILDAFSRGYDVEVDVWYVGQQLYLGHNEPQYKTDLSFLSRPGLWLHAKNLEALEHLSELNVFWHENDKHTLTQKGFIWSFPGQLTSASNGIIVMPEHSKTPFDQIHDLPCYGVCSDYVEEIKLVSKINRGW